MREKVNFLKTLHLFHYSEGGFTLLALYLIANMKNSGLLMLIAMQRALAVSKNHENEKLLYTEAQKSSISN